MEIEKLKDMLRNAAGGPVGIQMCQEAADALEQLQSENDRLKEEVQQMRWIPVEDGLPDKGDWVLAAYRGKGGKTRVEVATYNQKTKVHKRDGEVYVVLEGWYAENYWLERYRILDRVTHWTPLPQPPKESTP